MKLRLNLAGGLGGPAPAQDLSLLARSVGRGVIGELRPAISKLRRHLGGCVHRARKNGLTERRPCARRPEGT